MSRVAYDERYDPPMPVAPVRVGPPGAHPDVAVLALLDSGADRTVIPSELAEALDLPVIGAMVVRTVVGEGPVRMYALSMIAEGQVIIVRAVAAGDEVLLGRDALRRVVVTMDGRQGQLEIASQPSDGPP